MVAVADADDRHNDRAAEVFPKVLKSYQRLITSNLVVAETYIILRLALGHGPAMIFMDSLRESPRIERVYATSDLDLEAGEMLRRYQDQDFSYTDAVSFALMRQRGISTAFTFDAHFATAGFACIPTAS
jgi:predicted nucleic acid-binding protein